jgi:hypothetical protein
MRRGVNSSSIALKMSLYIRIQPTNTRSSSLSLWSSGDQKFTRTYTGLCPARPTTLWYQLLVQPRAHEVYVPRIRGKIFLALSYTPGHEEGREKGGINFRYSSRYQMGFSNELHAPAVLSTERDLGARWIGDGIRLRLRSRKKKSYSVTVTNPFVQSLFLLSYPVSE